MNRKRFGLQECQGKAGIQHRENSFRGGRLLLFVRLFFWILMWRLHCTCSSYTVFHCHHDFIIAVPSTSSNVLKLQHILELSGAKLSTEGWNTNYDMESF